MNGLRAVRFILLFPVILALIGLTYGFLLYASKVSSRPSSTAIQNMINHAEAMPAAFTAMTFMALVSWIAGY